MMVKSYTSRLVVAVTLLGVLWMAVPPVDVAWGQAVRTVRGEVVAVNVQASPPVIVVKARAGTKQDLIVGAAVETGATVTRGKVPIELGALKVGETVELTYVKNPEGLVARAIHAR